MARVVLLGGSREPYWRMVVARWKRSGLSVRTFCRAEDLNQGTFFVNQRLDVIDEKAATPDAYSTLPPTNRIEVHKAFLEHMDLIDAFADENPFGFDETDLGILRSWNHLVAGTFYAFRQLQE